MKNTLYAGVITISLILFLQLIVGCKQQRPHPQASTDLTGSTVVIEIDGYSYYWRAGAYTDCITPTPETIKRCIREVNNEKN